MCVCCILCLLVPTLCAPTDKAVNKTTYDRMNTALKAIAGNSPTQCVSSPLQSFVLNPLGCGGAVFPPTLFLTIDHPPTQGHHACAGLH